MLTYPEIDPVALSVGAFTIMGNTIGPLNIHWYGLTYLVGFLGCWALSIYRTRQRKQVIVAAQAEDLIFYGAMGVVIGARIGYILFYNFEAWMNDFSLIFRVWEGGMSFHGGLLGVAVAMLIYCRKIERNFFDMVDFVAPLAPIGLFCGRIGNFIGGELYGRITESPFGMIFPSDPGNIRHPSQLYEAFLEGLVLFVILFWFSNKPRPRCATIGVFVMMYGVFRFTVEFVRQPDAHIMFDVFGWMTRGQILCIPMIITGASLLVWAYAQESKKLKSNEDQITAAKS